MICWHIEVTTEAGSISILVLNVIEHEEQPTVVFPHASLSSFPWTSTFLTISSSTAESRSNCNTCTGLTPVLAGSVARLSSGLLVSISPPAGTTRDCIIMGFDMVKKIKRLFLAEVKQQKADQWADQCIVRRAASPA